MLDNLLNAITVAAWVFFAFMVAILALRAFQIGGLRESIRALTSWRVLLTLLITLFLTLLSASLVFVEPQEAGVVISLISPDGYRSQPLRSGLHWIVPLAERVVLYPIFIQNYTMSAEQTEGSKSGNDAIAARTSDGQAVFLDTSVIYRIDPNDVIRVHIDLQDRYTEDFIRPVLRGIVRTEVSQFTADEVNSSKRKNLEANLEEQIRESFREKGFILDKFLLRNIAFSPAYASAIEQKQVAEQDQIQREYQAEQMRKLAEGERDKLKLEADGRAMAILAEGKAQADVILLKAQAEASGLKLINEILQKNKDLLTYNYISKIAPGIKVMLVPNNNPYLLPLPDMGLDSGTPTPTPTPTPMPTPTPTPTVTP
jgi:regulator of protease activity HflC (stomatin/prohibitin superfamily)